MICLKCGQENDDKAKYCVFCHAKLKKTSAVDLVDEEEDMPVSPGEDPSLQTRTHNYLVIIAILCIAIAASSFLLLKDRMNDQRIFDLKGWTAEWFHFDQNSSEEISTPVYLELSDISESYSKLEESSILEAPSSEVEHTSMNQEGQQSSVSELIHEEACDHPAYLNVNEIHHRCTQCGHLEEHIWYVDNDAVYCRRCETLKEYITHEVPQEEDPQYERVETVIITGQYLNIRTGPGEEYPMLSDESMFYRHQYADIYEISYDDMWGRVRWNGMDGWIYLFYTNGLNEMT